MDFGNLTPLDMNKKNNCMRNEYGQSISIEITFKQIHDAQKFTVAGRYPYSVQQLVQCGIVHILKIQVYNESYKERITLIPMKSTCVHFKNHFLNEARLQSAVSATNNQLVYNTIPLRVELMTLATTPTRLKNCTQQLLTLRKHPALSKKRFKT